MQTQKIYSAFKNIYQDIFDDDEVQPLTQMVVAEVGSWDWDSSIHTYLVVGMRIWP